MFPPHRRHAQKSKDVGVLASGGLDSAALIYDLLQKNRRVWPVYVQCGLRWEKVELYWLKKFLRSMRHPHLKPLRLVRLHLEEAYRHNWSVKGGVPDYKSSDEAVYLPARNLLLIVKSLLYLSSRNVFQLALATLKGNPFPDATPAYFHRLEELLKHSFKARIKILAPFRRMAKKSVIALNRKAPLHSSFSCINPRGRFHCGRCNKCAERKRAFKEAKVTDRTTYCN